MSIIQITKVVQEYGRRIAKKVRHDEAHLAGSIDEVGQGPLRHLRLMIQFCTRPSAQRLVAVLVAHNTIEGVKDITDANVRA